MTAAVDTGHGLVRHGGRKLSDYFVFNTDHKVIGIQYMVLSFLFFMFGGILAELIRTELARPGTQFVSGSSYNQLFTIHGTIMIFLWIIPAFAGLANYVIPLQLGANDMAFPKLNALAFWLLIPGAILLLFGFWVGGAESGWTAYPPLSLQTGTGQTIWAIALQFIGFSSIFGAINFLVTIFNMRATGMTLMRLPLMAWAIISTSIIIVLGTPVLSAALAMLTVSRVLGANFFQASAGGDPLMWQNLFWFYSHPAVYIMILPGFGIISEVLPVFSRKPIFGYQADRVFQPGHRHLRLSGVGAPHVHQRHGSVPARALHDHLDDHRRAHRGQDLQLAGDDLGRQAAFHDVDDVCAGASSRCSSSAG